MQTRYYSQPDASQPGEQPQDTSPGRPWGWMLLLTVVFFFSHPHRLEQSLLFNEEARASDGSEELEAADENAAAVEEGSSARRFWLTLLGGVSILSLVFQKGPPLRLNGWLAVFGIGFLALMLASPFWASQSFLSFRRVVAVGIMVVTALAVARRLGIDDIMFLVVAGISVYLLIGVYAELRLGNFKPWSGGYRFSGTLHPNQQGIRCGLLAIASFAYGLRFPQNKKWCWAITVVAFVFLILTGSRTSLATALLGLGVLVFLHYPFAEAMERALQFATVSAVFLAIGAVVAGEKLDEKFASAVSLGRESSASKSNSLNGRIPLWKECSEYLTEQPLLGYGYKSFWTPRRIVRISTHQGWWIMQAHNGYLEMALSIGILGAGCFLAILLLGIKHALQLYREHQGVGAAFATAALCWIASNTMLEAWIDEPGLPSIVALTLLVSLIAFKEPLWERTPEAAQRLPQAQRNHQLPLTPSFA